MCPWSASGSDIETARCHPRAHTSENHAPDSAPSTFDRVPPDRDLATRAGHPSPTCVDVAVDAPLH